MRTYLEALPAGSYVVLSHFYAPEGEDGAMVHRIRQTMLERQLDADFFRTYREIEALFPAGLEFVEPGLAVLQAWWPDGPRLKEPFPVQRCILGAVARNP